MRNVILPTSGFKQKSHTLIKAFQEHQKYMQEPFRLGGYKSVKGLLMRLLHYVGGCCPQEKFKVQAVVLTPKKLVIYILMIYITR